MDKWISRLAFLALCLALTVIVLGAYTRLKDAGLGCPDWPGCYKQWTAPSTPNAIAKAEAAYPLLPVEIQKAQTEMTHRYFAESLGFLILLLGTFAWFKHRTLGIPRWLPVLLVSTVLFQGLLGMWTVTLRLLPLTVMGHLLGGFATLTLLWLYWLYARQPFKASPTTPSFATLRMLSLLTLGALIVQIFLGGWTSANYAALICPDFPRCQGQWWPQTQFSSAFNLLTGFGMENPLSVMTSIERTTIHITHRIGAIVMLILGGVLSLTLLKQRQSTYTRFGLVIGTLLLIQLTLGVSNVVMHLPLKIAVGHNAFAALLLLSLVALLFYLTPMKKKPYV